MKSTIQILLVLFLQFHLFSCDRRPYPYSLQVAGSLSDVYPDSALSLLEQIKDSITLESEETQIYYKLLLIKAKDKAYITHTSDSTIQEVLHYYKDKKHLVQAYYYAGRVYSDLEDAPRALDYFQKAIDVSDKNTDYALMSKIYSQIGSLFLYQDVYDKAPEMFNKAKHYSMLAKDSIGLTYTLRDIGRTYAALENKDSAIYYYTKADNLGKEIHNNNIRKIINGELAGYYTIWGDYKEAYQCMQRAPQNNPSQITVTARYYYSIGQLDSSFHYYSQLLSVNSCLYKCEGYQGLANIERLKDNPLKALAYFDRYFECNDSLQQITQTEIVRKIDVLYNYQLHQKENEKLIAKSTHQKTLIVFLSVGLTLLMAIFFTLWQYHKQKEKNKYNQQEKLIKAKEEQYKLSLAQIEKNNETIKSLDIKLYEAEVAQDKLLQELLKAQKELIEKTNEQIEARQRAQNQAKISLDNSKILIKIKHIVKYKNGRLDNSDWEELSLHINETYDEFSKRLYNLYPIKEKELRVCMLIKIGLTPTQISTIIINSIQAISSIRKRLYYKIFGENGTPEDLDNFIRNF